MPKAQGQAPPQGQASAPEKKGLSTGAKVGIGIGIGCLVIIAIIIAVVAIGCNKAVKEVEKAASQTPTPTPINPLAQFDGSYTGTSDAHQGITAATVNISNGSISGTANYVGSYNIQVVLDVTGTVDANGNVTGNLSGTGSGQGQNVTVTGTYTGAITGNTINVSYQGSGGGESASGSIVLTKK